jgi:hypothetical protein
LWVIFALLDQDPNSEYGRGSTDPIESGSNWDPDPQPCLKGRPSYRRSLQPSKENIHHLQNSDLGCLLNQDEISDPGFSRPEKSKFIKTISLKMPYFHSWTPCTVRDLNSTTRENIQLLKT